MIQLLNIEVKSFSISTYIQKSTYLENKELSYYSYIYLLIIINYYLNI
ncbi:hypothetical protein [Staphylococcus phage vB_SauM-V1SA12]|nr:hypothetical protein [Staphylococcus phage vB_SauM-V1SA12]